MFFWFFALFLILVTLVIKNCTRPKNFPPGPLFLPFIGSWYTIPPVKCEDKIEGWRKKYGNIIGHKIGHQYIVFISGFEEIIAGLKNINFQNRIHAKVFKYRSFQRSLGFFFADGEHWLKVRRFTLRFLGQVFYSKLESVMHDEMLIFFTTIHSGKITEIDNKFTDFAITVVSNLLMSKNKSNYQNKIERIRYLTNRAFKAGRPLGIEVVYPCLKFLFHFDRQLDSITYTQNCISECLNEHRATFDDNNIRDYIDEFLSKQKNEKELCNSDYYSDEQLFSSLLDLLQASSESVGNTTAFILLYVSLNSAVQDKIHKELDAVIGKERFPSLNDRSSLPYCEAVIYEAMRINTISPLGVTHCVSKDTEFYGYTLPKNCFLLFAHQDLFMNPEQFGEQPKLFIPERFLSKNRKLKLTNFGLGKRSCIGEVLSKNMLFLFLTYFFQKYSIMLPNENRKLNTNAEGGLTNSIKPFKLIINNRYDYK